MVAKQWNRRTYQLYAFERVHEPDDSMRGDVDDRGAHAVWLGTAAHAVRHVIHPAKGRYRMPLAKRFWWCARTLDIPKFLSPRMAYFCPWSMSAYGTDQGV